MMKRIFNFKLTSTLMLLFISVSTMAQDAPVKIDRPVYEDLGISPTTLFLVMLVFTIVLLFALLTVAKSASTVLRQNAEKAKKAGMVILFALMGNNTFAADTVEKSEYIINFPDSAFYMFLFIDIVIVFLILYFTGMIKGALYNPNTSKETKTIFSKWNKSLTNAVEIEDEDTILLDHDYDGIKELDNELPPWWKYGFYITIIWACIYIPYYHIFNPDKLQYGEFAAQMAEGEKEVAAYKAAHPNLVNEDNVELLTDDASLNKGKDIFTKNCTPCHGQNGGGGIGPNLTDTKWIYDGDIKGVFITVSEGASNGMVAWKNQLNPTEIQAVASYVLSLPPAKGGKEPQGDNTFERP